VAPVAGVLAAEQAATLARIDAFAADHDALEVAKVLDVPVAVTVALIEDLLHLCPLDQGCAYRIDINRVHEPAAEVLAYVEIAQLRTPDRTTLLDFVRHLDLGVLAVHPDLDFVHTNHKPTAHIERFHHTLTEEWAYTRHYNSDTDRTNAYQTWIHTYSNHKPHTNARGKTPTRHTHNFRGNNN